MEGYISTQEPNCTYCVYQVSANNLIVGGHKQVFAEQLVCCARGVCVGGGGGGGLMVV